MTGTPRPTAGGGDEYVDAFIGLGANLGDPLATLGAALEALDRLPRTRVAGCSSWYRSDPVDAEGPPFVNAVARLRTALSPQELLASLQAIEHLHGRVRPYPNAPRTLDLDLLLHGGQAHEGSGLTLPHPRMHRRAFVLRPLTELTPDLEIPGRGTVGTLLADCADQRIERIESTPPGAKPDASPANLPSTDPAPAGAVR